MADDCFATEDGGVGVDGDVIFDGGVPLFVFKGLAATGGKTAEGYALVNFHMISDSCRFTDNNAGSVIDEEIFANGRAAS